MGLKGTKHGLSLYAPLLNGKKNMYGFFSYMLFLLLQVRESFIDRHLMILILLQSRVMNRHTPHYRVTA
jgi:hypothetical protein